jgi:hypothetical protein
MVTLPSDNRPAVSGAASKSTPKRVLIVAPHFPPINAPDHQRVRMALPYLAVEGWQAEVLAVETRFIEAALDAELESTLPPDLPIHRTRRGRTAGPRPF